MKKLLALSNTKFMNVLTSKIFMAIKIRQRKPSIIASSILILTIGAGNVYASIEERDIYLLQLGAEFSDGNKVISHSQEAMMARSRQGDLSQVILDFRNSAVTIETSKGTLASVFQNESPAEVVYGYDYKKNELLGPKGFFTLFNKNIKNKLHNEIPQGENGSWMLTATFAELGVAGKMNGAVKMEISRKYETHKGQDIAIIEFNIPAFEYTAPNGKTVIQWGRGVAITDKGFGTIYAIGAQHQATVMEQDGSIRPVSMKVTAYGKKPNGEWRLDLSGFDIARKAMSKVSVGTIGKLHPVSFSSSVVDVDQFPFKLASNIQLMAFSAGEHSANGIAADLYAYLFENRGNDKQPASKNPGHLENLASIYGSTNAVLSKDLKAILVKYEDEWNVTEASYKKALKSYRIAEKNKRNLKSAYETIVAAAETKFDGYLKTAKVYASREKGVLMNIKYYQGLYDKAYKNGDLLTALKYEDKIDAQRSNIKGINALRAKYATQLEVARRKLMVVTENYRKIETRIPGSPVKPVRAFTRLEKVLNKMSGVTPDALKKLSKGGLKILGVIGKANSIYQIGRSIYAANQDVKDGESVFLARSYSYEPGGPVLDNVLNVAWDLGLDLGGLAANVYTGNLVNASLDAVTISLGSMADIYASSKAAMQAESQAKISEMWVEANRRILKRKIKYKNQKEKWDAIRKELDKEWAKLRVVGDYSNGYDTTDPRIDQSTGLPKLAYWRYLKKNDPNKLKRMGIDPDAPVGGKLTEISIKPVSNEPTEKEWNDFKRGLAEYIQKDKYPKARPRRPRPPKNPTNDKMYSDIPDWLIDRWNRDSELERRKRELEYVQLLKGMEKEYEKILREEKKIKRRKESGIDDAMEFYANNAFKYESMVGIVATDLSRWSEWLATQDVRRLERLALQAGYPNLASALADAANLIRNAGDSGYRRWANAAPSCAGYAGCGPQYQERWTMKLSQLRLGDILTKSRDIFSTAGLSDIGISGGVLNYNMRDFGVEDGDIVDIKINQFGTLISNSRLSLLNAGTGFSVNLRSGIASVEITAVNEGALSPNTAEINVDNVTRGNSRQTYSLRTGETAVLRVEPGQ